MELATTSRQAWIPTTFVLMLLPVMVQVLVIREAMGIPARMIMNAPTTTASMAIAAIPPAQRSARHVMSKAPLGAAQILPTVLRTTTQAAPVMGMMRALVVSVWMFVLSMGIVAVGLAIVSMPLAAIRSAPLHLAHVSMKSRAMGIRPVTAI